MTFAFTLAPPTVRSFKLCTPLNVDGGDPQQINVEVGGKVVDIASISPIVASAARFSIHRIYYDEAEEGLGERLGTAIQERVKIRLGERLKNDAVG
jgi:hypothetical protein